jgi:ATP-dependent DNA helicase RecG
MIHPELQILQDDELPSVDDALTPVYPTTEGLSQKQLRRIIAQATTYVGERGGITELVSRKLFEATSRCPEVCALELSAWQAIADVHTPSPEVRWSAIIDGTHPAIVRLSFEELLANRICLATMHERDPGETAPALHATGSLSDALEKQLPFEMTGAQRRAVAEIGGDLRESTPMNRLLQGDVGSGKTLVAAMAALHAIEAGKQCALMAPTELLAEQHYRTLSEWLMPLDVQVTWLTGRLKASEKRAALADIADGTSRLAIGTHALFQADVSFADLGLIIVDEQHRFGVAQRLALRDKGQDSSFIPHQLVMTATPIPRTLAMTAYADLATSILDELPPGRTPVETAVVPDSRRSEVVGRIHRACASGEQAYWVCPLIDESEVLQTQAATQTHEALVDALPDLNVGLVHGRMQTSERDAVMRSFKAGEVNLLVATTVIEVGVDVPNASLMIIENAERMGLAQLHQLRGRVGRGAKRSVCLLMYQAPLSETAQTRLQTMRSTTDGFEIAERDLAMRGPGELLGTKQTGLYQLRIADIERDRALLDCVNAAAPRVREDDPESVGKLINRWVGPSAVYRKV